MSVLDAQIREKLARIGVSDAARDWVIKALDPANGIKSDGIPDASSCAVTRPEYVVQASISCPTSIVSPTWDLMLIFPPGDCTACIWVAGTSGVDFARNDPGPGITVVMGTINFQTLEFKNTAGGNQLVMIQPPAGPMSNATFQIYAPTNDVLTFRNQYRSATCILEASDMSNQGEVFAAQYPFDARMKHLLDIDAQLPDATGYSLSQCSTVVIPFNESDLTLSARMPYVGRAKEGVYMPFRLTGPTQPFADVSFVGGVGTVRSSSDVIEGYCIGAAQSTTNPDALLEGIQLPHTARFVQNDMAGRNNTNSPFLNAYLTTSAYSSNTGWDNTMCGVMIWRGLSNNTSGNGASVLVKVIAGLEVCPRPTSPMRAYAKPPALYEPRAIEAYYAVAAQLSPAYPSRYNSLGAILPLISTAASRILPAMWAGGRAAIREMVSDDRPTRARPEVVVREKVVERASSKPRRSVSIRSVRSLKPAPKASARRKRR